MRRLIVIAAAAAALVLAASASAALAPKIFDPGHTGCVSSVWSNGALHLAKNCATTVNASAGADITGVNGQTFSSASFTLANAAQCQGGSPRFNVYTTGGVWFAGCNTVTPTTNTGGTATYTFTPANLVPAATGNTLGTITAAEVVIDVQGTADVSNITFNGQAEVPKAGETSNPCKHDGWKSFTNPSFHNQGNCVSFSKHQAHGHGHDQKGQDQRGHNDDND
jgi:hypothetical protein